MQEVEEQTKEQVKPKKTKPPLKYISATGFANRATRRAQMKAVKKVQKHG